MWWGLNGKIVSYLFHEDRPHTITKMNDNINMDSFYVVFNKSQEQLNKIVLFNRSHYLIKSKSLTCSGYWYVVAVEIWENSITGHMQVVSCHEYIMIC
jgi:hypothetical protein